MALNIWRAKKAVSIEQASLLLAGIDPLYEEVPDRIEYHISACPILKSATRRNEPNVVQAKQWHFRTKQALFLGELSPCTGFYRWDIIQRSWHQVERNDLKAGDEFDCDVDRSELVRWLLTFGINEDELPEFLRGVRPAQPFSGDGGDAPKRHILKRERQRETILAALRDMGFEPTALPPRSPGRKATKAKVRERLLKRPDLFTKGSFDKAWQSLRDSEELRESSYPTPPNWVKGDT